MPDTGSIRSSGVRFPGPVIMLFILLSFRELPDNEQLTSAQGTGSGVAADVTRCPARSSPALS